MMNRVEECAPVRLDAPLQHLCARGLVSVSGCMQREDKAIKLTEIGNLHDSIILLDRAVIRPAAWMCDLMAKHAARGNVLLQEIDDHPLIMEQIKEDDYFCFRAVSAVQTSTRYLADFLREFNPHIYLFENQLAELPERRTYDVPQGRVTIFFGVMAIVCSSA